jgi:hypothetical protein
VDLGAIAKVLLGLVVGHGCRWAEGWYRRGCGVGGRRASVKTWIVDHGNVMTVMCDGVKSLRFKRCRDRENHCGRNLGALDPKAA